MLQFSTRMGSGEMSNANYGRLVANAIDWAGQAPGCDIQLNKTSFINGEQVIAQVMRLTNPSAVPLPIELGTWLEIPTFAPVRFPNPLADIKTILAAGANRNLGPIPLFTVTAAFPRGTYGFHCRIVNPVTKQRLAEDFNTFQLQ